MNPLIKLWDWITGKVDIPPFPAHFGIVTFSPEGIERGLNDDQNKIIIHWHYDKFGNYVKEFLPYSKERVFAMENVRKIPIIDKTEITTRFPIFGKILPQEVAYETYG